MCFESYVLQASWPYTPQTVYQLRVGINALRTTSLNGLGTLTRPRHEKQLGFHADSARWRYTIFFWCISSRRFTRTVKTTYVLNMVTSPTILLMFFPAVLHAANLFRSAGRLITPRKELSSLASRHPAWGSPKAGWFINVYHGKPQWKWMIWGYPHLRNLYLIHSQSVWAFHSCVPHGRLSSLHGLISLVPYFCGITDLIFGLFSCFGDWLDSIPQDSSYIQYIPILFIYLFISLFTNI